MEEGSDFAEELNEVVAGGGRERRHATSDADFQFGPGSEVGASHGESMETDFKRPLPFYQEVPPHVVQQVQRHENEILKEIQEVTGEENADVLWCFMCEYKPGPDASGDHLWQDLDQYMREFGSREPLAIYKNVQRYYDMHFRSSCGNKKWYLLSIQKHILEHGGVETKSIMRESARVINMLISKVLNTQCQFVDTRSGELSIDPAGIDLYLKLLKQLQAISKLGSA